VLTLNVQRVFTLTQALLPLIEKAGKRDGCGRVINIGSINGVSVPPMATFAYSASKAALHQLTRHLAAQVDGSVTVNALALGPFRSKMMAATLEAGEAAIAGALPSNRIGSPQDVAAACIWLSSRGGEWVTGNIIPVDGGSLLTGGAKL
jgi:NAD(P)-dependent dehydrogenase (short-subunit alcohol dehydrogenase family)